MNPRPLLISLGVGLVAGVAVGSFRQEPPKSESSLSASLSLAGTQASEPSADAAVRLAFPGDDGRIGRVFSALHQPILILQRSELHEALRVITAAELPGMVKHAASLSSAARAELLPALAERWFELDPEAAQAWALSTPMERSIIEAWARANPESAYQVATASQATWADRLLYSALEAMHGKDVAAMMAKAQTLPPGQLRNSVFRGLLYELAKQDPTAAYAALDQLPAGQWRENNRENVFIWWAQKDPSGALAKLSEILPTLKAGVLGNELITRIAQLVAAKDPQLALEWLSGIPDEFRSIPAVATARTWARKEPLAALEWCLENGVDLAKPEWQGRDSWQPAVLGEAMGRAPKETFARLEAMPPGAERDRLLECAFMESLWHTPKDQLFADDGAMAWAFFEQLPEEGQIAKAYLFGERRAQRGDFKDLNAWAQSFPPGQARANAVTGAMTTAYQRNASGAEALLASTTPGPDRDAALRGLAEVMGRTAPTEAAARALQIGNRVVQQDALEAVIVPWLARDPEAGRKWLDGAATIPVAWKQQWMQSR